ncbi:MAG: nicotinate phosphoribosyltransferase, partial [Lachnospiraceae bacterium]|nr:nicotinate phosphoribosyltransferase [Lachnospiraceae bacterium]
MFVEAGLPDVKICLSNGLKPDTLASLIRQGAIIDSIGLGDNIVLPDAPRVGCVYKEVAIENDGMIIPKIKVAEAS